MCFGRTQTVVAILLSLTLIPLAAISGESPSLDGDKPAVQKKKAEPWGSIKGRILWKGKIPKTVMGVFAGVPFKANQPWVINSKNKGIRYAFVWIQPIRGGDPLKIHPELLKIKKKTVTMNIVKNRFEPQALGVREGQTLKIVSGTAKVHAPRTKGTYDFRAECVTINPKAHRTIPVLVNCDINKWMRAHARVFDHLFCRDRQKRAFPIGESSCW